MAIRRPALSVVALLIVAGPAPAQSPPDLSGLWVISNRSQRGFRDEALQPIQGEVFTA